MTSVKPILAFAGGAFGATLFWYAITHALASVSPWIVPFYLRIGFAVVFLGVLVTSLTLAIRVMRVCGGSFINILSAIACGAIYASLVLLSPKLLEWASAHAWKGNEHFYLFSYLAALFLGLPILCAEFIFRRCYKISRVRFSVVSIDAARINA